VWQAIPPICSTLMKALTQVRFNDKGLIPAIAQDFETGEVLMFAWMNQESLSLTIIHKWLLGLLILC
jgi:phosphoribosyl-AMP cyclohydrolase